MMIKINLLPLESFKQSASGQLSVTIFAFVIVALGILLYFFKGMVMDPAVAALEKEKTDQTAKLQQLKAEGAQALQRTNGLVTQLIQISAIAELEERRRDQTRLFSSLAEQVFNQTSWLTAVNHSARSVLTLRGLATDQEVVAAFLNNLEHNPLLSNVVLNRMARDVAINNIFLFSFDIQAETRFAPPSLMASGIPGVEVAPEEFTRLITIAAPTLASQLTVTQSAPQTL
ncbi:MAG: PilN domain-containing protein [Deltaproteobacteria bacterium]|jgi:Tfp pilus assembly protein PilN|nr:PilN domain-containing protein [Deltaproteobacteria bacterium]